MVLKRARLTNWCQHRLLTVEFRPGLNGILGPNGKGKSNFLDSLRFGFTAQTINGGANKDNVTWGQEAGSVELEFDDSGIDYTLVRAIETSRCSLRFNGQRLSKAGEIEDYLVNLYEAPLKLMLDNVFIAQGKIDQILSARPADRLKEFQASFGLDRALEAYKLLGIESNSCQVTTGLAELLHGALQAVHQSRQQIREMTDQAAELQDRIASLIPSEQLIARALEATRLLETIKQADEQVGRAITAASVATQRLTVSSQALREAGQQVERSKGSSDTARQQIRLIELALDTFKRSQDGLARIATLKRELAELTVPDADHLGVLKITVDQTAAHRATLVEMLRNPNARPKMGNQQELEDQIRQLEFTLKQPVPTTTPDISRCNYQLTELTKELVAMGKGRCYACGQEVHGGPAMVAAKQKEFDEVTAYRATLVEDFRLRQQCDRAIDESQLSEARTKLSAMEKIAIEVLTRQLADVDATVAPFITELAKAQKDLQAYRDKQAMLTASESAFSDSTPEKPDVSLLESLQRIVSDHTVAEAELQRCTTSHPFVVEQANQATGALEEAKRFRDSLGSAENIPTSEQIEEAKLKVKELVVARSALYDLSLRRGVADGLLDQRSTEAKRLLEQSRLEADQAAWLEVITHTRDALHVSQYPAQAMREYADILNAHIEGYLSLLEAPFKMWLDDSMEFQVLFTSGEKKGYQLPGHRLSGGERILASASFRLAMSDTFARKMGLLVLDEPSAYLDDANIQHLQVLLLKLREISRTKGRQILIVTHDESLKGFLDHVITI